MIKKSKEIRDFTDLVINTFGEMSPVINDHWESDTSAIGLQKDNKLIYIANYGKNNYFYECEILKEDHYRNRIINEKTIEISIDNLTIYEFIVC